MVLESIFSSKKIENKPLDMLLLSILITSTSFFLSTIVFPEYVGIVFPLIITMAMTPVVYNIFNDEESQERMQAKHIIEKTFLERHGEIIYLFSLFFLGVFLSTFVITLFLPEEKLLFFFKPQIDSITTIKSASGAFMSNEVLFKIVLNNLKIMLFAFVFSLVFSTGALFILSWNASIIAIFLANFIRGGSFSEFINVTLQIIPHAPVEFLAYFLAGIAGGILSAGIIRENVRSKAFVLILKDSLILLGLSIIAVLAGALLETYL